MTLTHDEITEHVLADQHETKAEAHRAPRRFAHWALAVLGLVVVFFGVLAVRNWTAGPDTVVESNPGTRVMPTSAAIEEKYGVRFVGVDVTSAGGMIQVRYQVIDRDKAGAVHNDEATPHILSSDGTDYGLPGMPGHSHIGPVQKAGATDFVLLANARGGVKHGSTVTIKMGELELRGVPVN